MEKPSLEHTKDMFSDFTKKMENRIKDLSDQIKDNIIPDTEEKLRKNVFTSIMISFGVGLVSGILVMIFAFLPRKK